MSRRATARRAYVDTPVGVWSLGLTQGAQVSPAFVQSPRLSKAPLGLASTTCLGMHRPCWTGNVEMVVVQAGNSWFGFLVAGFRPAPPSPLVPAEPPEPEPSPTGGRGLIVLLARLVPRWHEAMLLVRPEAVLRWHRQGFRLFWQEGASTDGAWEKRFDDPGAVE